MIHQISLFQQATTSSSELIDQTLSSLEKWSDRLTDICDELQKAANDKINLSKTKLNEFRSEIQNVMREIESNGKLAHI